MLNAMTPYFPFFLRNEQTQLPSGNPAQPLLGSQASKQPEGLIQQGKRTFVDSIVPFVLIKASADLLSLNLMVDSSNAQAIGVGISSFGGFVVPIMRSVCALSRQH